MRGKRAGRRFAPVLVTWAILLAAGAAEAQPRLELSGFAGSLAVSQSLGAASNVFFSASGEAEDIDFGKWYGVRASYALGRFFAVEASFSRGDNAYRFDVDDKELGAVALGTQLEATQTSYALNGVVQVPVGESFVPYGTVGFGGFRTEPDVSLAGAESVTASGLNVGGGLKVFLPSPSWLGFRLDVRRYMMDEGIGFGGLAEEPDYTDVTLGVVVRLF